MDEHVKKIMDLKIERTVKNLESRQFEVFVVENGEEAVAKVKGMIPSEASVNLGGSQTLFELGLVADLEKMDVEFQNRYATDADVQAVFRAAYSADVYITSTNAITEEGILYNVDGNGNRVSAMIYGPKVVIVIVGINKLVKDMKAAVARVHEIAGPMNNARLNKDTPCTMLGTCTDCVSPDRICAAHVAISRSQTPKRIKIIMVKESFGY